MCLVIRYIHAGCNHAKKFSTVEACRSSDGIACNELITLHVITITAPALCIDCYRQREAEIDAEYETSRRDLQSEMARLDECFATNRIAAGSLQKYRAECEDNILQVKASRDVSIRMFRQKQGVWGDG